MVAPKAERPGQSVPRIRSAYDGSRVQVRLICTEDEDKTQQQFKDECDINVLMARYEKTGILPQGRDLPPQYADVSAMDFTESMNQIAMVNGVFSQLDARTRARFENNPEYMLEFIADPENKAEAVKLGLLPKELLNEGGDSVRGSEVGVQGPAGPGGVRPGAERVDVPGRDAGSGSPAVPPVVPAAGSGSQAGSGGA